MSILDFIIGCPLLAAIGLAFVPRNYRFVTRLVALAATFATMLAAFVMFARFDAQEAAYQFVHRIPWVESLGISYYVGVDGINVGLLLMGAIVAFAAACVSWEVQEREKEYYILLLVMTGGIFGAFASLDLFFFYFFHELALVPTFIMIGVWGRGANKNYATFNITLYLSLGALIALIGLVLLYLQSGAQTFDIEELTRRLQSKPIKAGTQNIIFPLLMFGFGILVSLWPFHTWAPLGYGAAPTATAMLHAGVLKKFGLYGLIRVALPLLPAAFKTPILSEGLFAHFPFSWFPGALQHWLLQIGWMDLLALLCLGNILYCGLVAIQQKDLNQLIGNSSVAHMGFIFLGIASLTLVGVTGAVMVMIAHGLLAALSFGLSGYLYQQTKTLDMGELGGLLRKLPFAGAALVMAMLAGCGLPGFANFVGEVMVFFGSWERYQIATIIACWGGLVIGAVYMLRAVRSVLHGPLPGKWAAVQDTGPWRRVPFVLLLASLLYFGFYPGSLLEKIKPSAQNIVNLANNEPPPPVKGKGGARPVRTAQTPAPTATR
ncbi:MAG: NADH-quinone oxidoreductase subunit M [Verrucomicrobiota bacterium]